MECEIVHAMAYNTLDAINSCIDVIISLRIVFTHSVHHNGLSEALLNLIKLGRGVGERWESGEDREMRGEEGEEKGEIELCVCTRQSISPGCP